MKYLSSLLASAALLCAAHLGAAAPVVTSNGEFSVEYLGKTTESNWVTFSWKVCKLVAPPAGKGISHANFALDFSSCLPGVDLCDIVVGGTVTDSDGGTVPAELVFGTDPTTGVTGVKFDQLDLDDAQGACYIFTLTLDAGLLPPGYTYGEGAVMFATKAGNQDVRREGDQPGYVEVIGPVCMEEEAPHEGLSPGFWKNHAALWPAPYTAVTKLADAGFVGTLTQNDSLMTALNYGGGNNVAGAQRILLRAAVAALLNAADAEVNYPLSVAQVLAQCNAAIATGSRPTMLALADTLDGSNNLGLHD